MTSDAQLDQQPATPAPTTPTVPTDPAGIAARDAELTALFESDKNRYQYEDGGRFANEHLAIKKAQQSKDGEQQGADQAEGDDLNGVDVSDIDLDAPADEPGAGEEEEAEQEREPLEPWSPPDGGEISEVAKPHLASLDDIVSDPKLSAEQKRNGILDAYHELINDQKARLAEADKVASKAAVEALGGKEAYAPLLDSAKTVMKSWPKELRDAVRDARTSTGVRLALMPEFVRALASMGERQAAPNPQDNRTAMQQELAEIDSLMATNIDAYNGSKWRNTGLTPSDRRMAIMREKDNPTPKPSASALRTEEAELLALYARDPQTFEYSPRWKNTGKTAAQRLYELRQGRA